MSDDVVFASDYFPVGLWVGPSTCLVFTDESPDPKAVTDLVSRLSDRGLREIDVADDLRAAVLSLTMARVQDIGGVWAVWSADEATARGAITAAVSSEL